MPIGGNPTAKFVLAAERVGQEAFASMERDLGKLKGTATLVGAAAAGALVVLTKQSFASIDALAKVSDQLGISTQALASLRLAADLAGVESSELDADLKKMANSVAEAAAGTGAAKDAFNQLHLSAKQLKELPLEEQFHKISAALSGVANANDRVRLAMDIFGKEGQKLIPLMKDGAAALDDAAKFAERFGLAISRVDAAKVEQANDAVQLAAEVFRGLGNVIAVEVAPYVTALANGFISAAGNADQMGQVVRATLDGIVFGVGLVMDAYRGWELLILGLRAAVLDLYALELEAMSKLVLVAETVRSKAGKIPLEIVSNVASAVNPLIGLGVRLGSGFVEGVAKGIGEDATASDAIANLAESLRATAGDAERTLSNLAAAERPSVALAAGLAAARAEAQALAEATARAVSATGPQGDVGFSNAQALLIANMEAFSKQRILVARNAEIELTKVYRQGEAERLRFQKQSSGAKLGEVFGEIEAMTAGVAQYNKTAFALNKGAALASAVLAAKEGVARTLSKYPYPWNIPMAALHAAAAAAQIHAISSTSFEGGGAGTTPSAAGSVPVMNDQPLALPAPGGGRSEERAAIHIEVHTGPVIGEGGKMELGRYLHEIIDEFSTRTGRPGFVRLDR